MRAHFLQGQCTAGFYCPTGSTTSTANPCPAGNYCPAGSAEPTACPLGSYCPGSCSWASVGSIRVTKRSATPFAFCGVAVQEFFVGRNIATNGIASNSSAASPQLLASNALLATPNCSYYSFNGFQLAAASAQNAWWHVNLAPGSAGSNVSSIIYTNRLDTLAALAASSGDVLSIFTSRNVLIINATLSAAEVQTITPASALGQPDGFCPQYNRTTPFYSAAKGMGAVRPLPCLPGYFGAAVNMTMANCRYVWGCEGVVEGGGGHDVHFSQRR